MASQINSGSSSISASYDSQEGLAAKKTMPLSTQLKCALAAFVVVGIAGIVIASLGAINLFGPVGSIEFIATLAGGGALVLIGIGGGAFIICYKNKKIQ